MRHLLMVLSSYALVCVFALSFAHAQTTPGVPTPSATGQDAQAEAKTVKPPASASSPLDSAPAQDIVPAIVSASPSPAEKTKPVRIVRFEKPPVIDGLLKPEEWDTAAVLKDFFQTHPGDNIAPSKPTEVRLGYDNKFLYVAFRAYDEADKVRATLAKRDAIFTDDYVGIFFDTFNDRRRAYALYFNPLGVQADAVYSEGRGEDFSVDIVVESKGTVTPDGYTVEVAIPFKSLRYEAGKNRLWGIHAFRRIKRLNNEQSSWMPLSRDKSGLLNQAGNITGLEGIATERTLEIIPSLTISETGKHARSVLPALLRSNRSLIDPGRFVNEPIKLDPGLTAKLGITPTITLDLALNPDFAQIEADQLVVQANQRFPIFFEEKRPFFLEGADVFLSPLNIVHTRTIIDPDYAMKLTGKRGRNTFGILFASDNAPGNFTEDERTEIRENFENFTRNPSRTPFDNRIRLVDRNAYIGVLRLKRDLGKENSLGLFATSYDYVDRHNHLGGLDGRLRFDPKTVLSFQVVGTNTRRNFFDPQLGSSIYRTGNAFAYFINYTKQGRNFSYVFVGDGRTRDYRADVGFVRRADTNRESLRLIYASTPKPKARLIRWDIFNFTQVNYDWRARMQLWESEVQATLNFPMQTFFGGGFEGGYERLFEEEFGASRTPTRRGTFAGNDSERSSNKKHFFLYGGTTPSKKYSVDVHLVYRIGELDLDSGAGPRFPRISPGAIFCRANSQLCPGGAQRDPGSGRQLEVQAAFAYQPTNTLRTTLDYTKTRLVRDDTGRVAFDENIFSLRTTYQFTRFIFFRGRLDYSTLESRMLSQLLLAYTPSPGTAFYAGYNDDFNRNGFSPFTGQLEPGFRRNSRTFFIKMSYLFRRSL